jgi:primosomal replication protein N
VDFVKKFLFGFGGLLILLGAGGIINHISMAIKSVQEEQEMYGGSVHFMILQLMGTMEPYLTSLIGGGVIIAIAVFLNEYKNRNKLTSQLIQVLLDQQSKHPLTTAQHKEPYSKQEETNNKDTAVTTTKPDSDSLLNTSTSQDDERFYWRG